MQKRGTILVENIIFIILNLIFLTILVLFIARQGEGAVILEESYAKEIALLIDSAKPGMKITLNMQDAVELAKKEKYGDKIISIDDNLVTVKIHDKGGSSYSFFNDVELSRLHHYADAGDEFIFEIERYK